VYQKSLTYRAEKAMARPSHLNACDGRQAILLQDFLAQSDDAGALLLEISTIEADLISNMQDGTLTFRIHHPRSLLSNKANWFLDDHLNALENCYPDRNLPFGSKLVSDYNLPLQEF
jgi:hypothetical protein